MYIQRFGVSFNSRKELFDCLGVRPGDKNFNRYYQRYKKTSRNKDFLEESEIAYLICPVEYMTICRKLKRLRDSKRKVVESQKIPSADQILGPINGSAAS